ncbi:hypothetical protein K1719_029698 [Acacia pycnantha]|nr:hypothetical protein K1719_029698 [Acacia pycnantha]
MLLSHRYSKVATTILFVVAQIWLTVNSFSEEDEIHSLPGQPPAEFRQYGGYITVDDENQRALFYYFVEAEGDYMSKPLVLWLEGGPGTSSLGAGAFVEHGPFKLRENALVKNDYSWNKDANMLYLESPAGVGFSYSSNQSFYGFVNDEITARDNLVFLQRWFNKFPEYKNNFFFIAGESYGGHFVPQLAQLITHTKTQFNLKGIAVGNPLLEFSTDFNSVGEFLWSHGLISDSTLQSLTTACNFSQITRQNLISKTLTPVCKGVYTQMLQEAGEDFPLGVVSPCLSTISEVSQLLKKSQEIENYLNRKDVQEALHAKLIGVTKWSINGREVVKYDIQDAEIPIIPILKKLVESGLQVLVYSGDQDAGIPLTGTRMLVDELAKEMALNPTVPYRSWFQGRQVAGWTQVYGNNTLSFVTIRGGVHLTSVSQPERYLLVFQGFLQGKPLLHK